MNDLPSRVFQIALVPLWAATLFVVARFASPFLHALNERLRIYAEAKASDWNRLRDEVKRIDERCKALEEENQECRKNLADAVHRIAQLEGYQLGRGEAAQEATRFTATKRIIDDKLKDGGK